MGAFQIPSLQRPLDGERIVCHNAHTWRKPTMAQTNDKAAGTGGLGKEFRRALLETIPCALFIFNLRGRIIYWNRSAEELTGYTAGEMLGQTCEPLPITEAQDGDREVVAAVCAAGQGEDASAVECEVRHKAGRAVPVVRRTKPVLSRSGEQLGVVVRWWT